MRRPHALFSTLCAAAALLVAARAAGADDARRAAPAKPDAAKAGPMLVVFKDAPCKETGPGASDQPWKVKKGAFVLLLANESAVTRVETAPGSPPCLIASNAVRPR